jgi:hypothetical protein
MKHILNIIAALAFVLGAITSRAAEARYVFAGTGTAISTTNSHYIIPASGVGVPVITYLDATGDTSPSVLTFRTASTKTAVTTAASASATTLVCVGTGFSAGNTIVLQHVTADTYERLVVSTASATNIVTTAGIGTAAAAGDVIWLVSTAGTASGFTTTAQRYSAGGLFSGDRGKPILVNLTGTNTPTLNAVSGYYLKP